MSQTIYVVDDQVPVLEMTVLVLRRLGDNWEVTGFDDPDAALEAVKMKPPSAILSDQVMPKMSGSELLEKVRQISPSTIRFIMSGCVAMSKLTLITSAHQYIAKPYEPSKMKDLFVRSFGARQRILNTGLEEIATSLRSIPSLPQAHHSLLKELEDSNGESRSIARWIAADPGLAVKVLHMANSGLFSHGRVLTDLPDAIALLGTDVITAVVLAQSLFRHYEGLKGLQIDLNRMWTHSWETACIAQRLSGEMKLPRPAGDEVFLAGLMHEVGRFILADNYPDQFQAACRQADEAGTPLASELRAVFRGSPYQLAAYVLELWGLPSTVVNSISMVDQPEKDPAPGFSPISALYVADHIASQTSPADPGPLEPWNQDYLAAAGCAEHIADWQSRFSKPSS